MRPKPRKKKSVSRSEQKIEGSEEEFRKDLAPKPCQESENKVDDIKEDNGGNNGERRRTNLGEENRWK